MWARSARFRESISIHMAGSADRLERSFQIQSLNGSLYLSWSTTTITVVRDDPNWNPPKRGPLMRVSHSPLTAEWRRQNRRGTSRLLYFKVFRDGGAPTLRSRPGGSVTWQARSRNVVFPYWCALMPSLIFPTLWLARRTRHRRRRAAGRCHHCGYDLRATPGRCPECGTAAAGVRVADELQAGVDRTGAVATVAGADAAHAAVAQARRQDVA